MPRDALLPSTYLAPLPESTDHSDRENYQSNLVMIDGHIALHTIYVSTQSIKGKGAKKRLRPRLRVLKDSAKILS